MKKTLSLLAVLSFSMSAGFAQCADEIFELLPTDGAAGDFFGWSVALNTDTAIVGALNDDDLGASSGSVYLFDLGTGMQTRKLLASDGAFAENFGFSVAVDSSTAIVGAIGDDYLGFPSGSAYLFDVPSGNEITKLIPDDGQQGDDFGSAVAISGNLALVGTRGDDDLGASSGSAYLFDTQSGLQVHKLLAGDGSDGDEFGFSAALAGSLAIIGAPEDDNGQGVAAGAAYLFDGNTGLQVAKLLASDGAAGDRFGTAVAIQGNIAIVGASCDDDLGSCSGAAYLFDVTTGLEIRKLLPANGAAFSFFGAAVALNSSTALVGAYGDQLGVTNGSAYLFDLSTGQQVAELAAGDGQPSDFFGRAVAINSNMALMGAIRHGDQGGNSGSSYQFSTESRGTSYCMVNPNSAGLGARMQACGSLNISANHFSLSAEPVPNLFYIFFYGSNQNLIPLGDGFLCASGTIRRLGAPQLATGNVATLDVDLPGAGIVTAGTFNFQCWFRDPSGGPAGFNLSDGTSVTFVP